MNKKERLLKLIIELLDENMIKIHNIMLNEINNGGYIKKTVLEYVEELKVLNNTINIVKTSNFIYDDSTRDDLRQRLKEFILLNNSRKRTKALAKFSFPVEASTLPKGLLDAYYTYNLLLNFSDWDLKSTVKRCNLLNEFKEMSEVFQKFNDFFEKELIVTSGIKTLDEYENWVEKVLR